jgi:membrane protease YdiL (CAAX protease family)
MSDLAGILLTFLPLFLILLLANGAERARKRDTQDAAMRAIATVENTDTPVDAEAALVPPPVPFKPRDDSAAILRAIAYLLLGGLYLVVSLGALGLFAFTALSSSQPELAAQNPLGGMVDNPALVAWGLLLPASIGILLLLPAVRRFCARYIPIDATNTVHAVALSMTMLVIINMLITIGVGLANLSTMVSEAEEAGVSVTSFAGIWGQQILMALLAFVGVGWPLRRGWRETLRRLGLVWPSMRQILLGMGLAVIMVVVVMVIQAIAMFLGFAGDADVEELTEQLLGPLFNSPWGILTLGLAAALGEETLMRGAAQPRLGLLLTATLFALLHSNYGITLSTGVVLLLGLVLGIVRIRENTSTAMILHATYNIILGVLAYLSVDLLQQISK